MTDPFQREKPSIKSGSTLRPGLAIAISTVAALALVGKLWAQSRNPALKFDDALTVGLLILFAVPWLAPLLESAKFAGTEIKFSQLARQQQVQAAELERQQQELHANAQLLLGIIKSMVGEKGDKFLGALQGGELISYRFSDDTKAEYRAMLRQLRLLGFIEMSNRQGVHDVIDSRRPEVELSREVSLTPAGRDYLQSRLSGLQVKLPESNQDT